MSRDMFQTAIKKAERLLKINVPQLGDQNEIAWGLRKQGVSVVVNARYFEETDEAMFYVSFPAVADEDGDIASALLERNAFSDKMGGAIYAMTPESGTIVLQMKFNCAAIDGATLARSLSAFLKEAFAFQAKNKGNAV